MSNNTTNTTTQLINLLRKILNNKPIKNIRFKIKELKKTIKERGLKDTILVIILLAVLGLSGWIEYNERTLTHTEKEVKPITIRLVPSLREIPRRLFPDLPNSEVSSLAFSATDAKDSQIFLAVGSQDGTVSLSKLSKDTKDCADRQIEDIKFNRLDKDQSKDNKDKDESRIWSVAFSLHGKILASGTDEGNIHLWKLSGDQLTYFKKIPDKKNSDKDSPNSKSILSVAFSPDGKILASGSRDGTIKLWKFKEDGNAVEIKEKDQTKQAQPEAKGITSVAFNQDGDLLASGSQDGTIKLWDVSAERFSNKATQKHGDAAVMEIAFSPSHNLINQILWGQQLASGSWDGTIKLWNTGELGFSEFNTLRQNNKVISLTYSHNGQVLASGSYDGTITLWDSSNGNKVRTLRSHPYAVTSLAFTPDDCALASGSDDETVKIWQAHPRNLPGWRKPLLFELW